MLNLIFLGLLTLSFLLSGINNDVNNITHLTVIASIAVGFLSLRKTNYVSKAPPYFLPLLIFSFTLQIYWIFNKTQVNPFYYSLLFSEGLSIWYIIYNSNKRQIRNVYLVFLVPALVYALFELLSLRFNISLQKLAALFFQPGQTIGHLQIGNLWALILIFLLGSRLFDIKFKYDSFLLIIGLYFLVISGSRSAYVAILASLLFLFKDSFFPRRLTRYFLIMLLGAIVVYLSLNRSILTSRPYYLQSLISFFKYPFGVGMGNFRQISIQYYNAGGLLSSFSNTTHNIFLEALSGVGIFSIAFVYWAYKIFKDGLKNIPSKNLGWASAFIALSVMFIIDLTYTIPGMFWLWFILLGMMQRGRTAI